MKSKDDMLSENISKAIADGPRLRTDYNQWIIAKDTKSHRVKVGGLGSFGIGEMWIDERECHKEYPGYDDAPEQKNHGPETVIWPPL